MPNSRFDDPGKRGMDNPLVLLGQLHSRVGRLETDTIAQTNMLTGIQATLTQIQLKQAESAATRKGSAAVWKLGQLLLTISLAIVTTWASVKALGHGP